MDLSPREVAAPASAARRSGKRIRAISMLLVVLVGGGVVVTKFLTSAIDYYCNVDDIGVKSGCDEDRRIRVQGNVDEGSISNANGVTTFVMSFHGATLAVRYEGDPGGIFQECVPVVVHGRIAAASADTPRVFEGDKVEVKHDNEYTAENGDRLEEAESACSAPA